MRHLDEARPSLGGLSLRGSIIALIALLLASGAVAQEPPTSPTVVGTLRPGVPYLKGYLDRGSLPDSARLLPPPPSKTSAARAADVAAFVETRDLMHGPRGRLAERDADLGFPQVEETFACALGVQIATQETPHLTMLLRRTLTDAGLATYRAKNRYNRSRPFVAMSSTSCTPDEEPRLAKDGSYPSGHAAIGWAWGLMLAEMAPDRADAVLQRGYAFGQSRVICGVHWQSDVVAGRTIGSAVVARLQSDPTFRAQFVAAAAELTAARSRSATAAPECTAENAALADQQAGN